MADLLCPHCQAKLTYSVVEIPPQPTLSLVDGPKIEYSVTKIEQAVPVKVPPRPIDPLLPTQPPADPPAKTPAE